MIIPCRYTNNSRLIGFLYKIKYMVIMDLLIDAQIKFIQVYNYYFSINQKTKKQL